MVEEIDDDIKDLGFLCDEEDPAVVGCIISYKNKVFGSTKARGKIIQIP
jgi:hypothetical protein